MRRVLSLSLLALFSSWLILPILFAGRDGEEQLPACCRRDGKHHCAMMKTPAPASGVAVQSAPSRCALYPTGSVAPMAGAAGAADPVSRVFGFLPQADVLQAEMAVGVEAAHARLPQERGPPPFVG